MTYLVTTPSGTRLRFKSWDAYTCWKRLTPFAHNLSTLAVADAAPVDGPAVVPGPPAPLLRRARPCPAGCTCRGAG